MSDEGQFSFSLSSGTGEPSVDDGLLADENAASTADASTPAGVHGPTDDADEGEVEPVEVLVTLAENGEIDPWDIDIVAVTDAFLAKLDESDLRASGRALFYASVLLRMKSDEMLSTDDPGEPDPEPWEAALEGGREGKPAAPGFDPVDALEAEMDRRLDRKSTRGTPETLDELVRELREAERGGLWKQSRSYDTSDSPTGYARGTQTLDYHGADDRRREDEPTEDDVTGTTHDEEIETVIADVWAAVREQYQHGRDEVLFAEVREAGGRPMMTYLGLLFLSHRGDVRLSQNELFGDLWIQDPDAVAMKGTTSGGVEMNEADAEEEDDGRERDSAVVVEDD